VIFPERVPPATPEQAAEAMRLSIDQAAIPPGLLDLITDPRINVPGDPRINVPGDPLASPSASES